MTMAYDYPGDDYYCPPLAPLFGQPPVEFGAIADRYAYRSRADFDMVWRAIADLVNDERYQLLRDGMPVWERGAIVNGARADIERYRKMPPLEGLKAACPKAAWYVADGGFPEVQFIIAGGFCWMRAKGPLSLSNPRKMTLSEGYAVMCEWMRPEPAPATTTTVREHA